MGTGPVYLSFDIDSLDPAYAPGTGTPEIAGLTPIQVCPSEMLYPAPGDLQLIKLPKPAKEGLWVRLMTIILLQLCI